MSEAGTKSTEQAAWRTALDPRGDWVPHVIAAMDDRLAHVHIADGLGTARDEHLVPGRGTQPCAELLEGLAVQGFDGLVVVEVNTRKCEDRA